MNKMKSKIHSILAWIMAALMISQVLSAVENKLETCQDEKCFKTMLKARPNLLVLFSETGTPNSPNIDSIERNGDSR